MEFHISRQTRDRYSFDHSLYAYSGNVIFANFHAARLFAQKINQTRDLANFKTGLPVREMATEDEAHLWISLDGLQVWED